MTDATTILSRIAAGEAKAADELLPIVYNELRRIAAAKLSREANGHTLQTTAVRFRVGLE